MINLPENNFVGQGPRKKKKFLEDDHIRLKFKKITLLEIIDQHRESEKVFLKPSEVQLDIKNKHLIITIKKS